MVIELLIGFAAAADVHAATQPNQPPPIVVTGERIGDLRARLRACIARNCPPNEEIDAALALAEGEFLNGEYERAEDAIDASISRNRRHRRAFPEPVADLYRAQARVQWHRGRDLLADQSTYEVLRTLRAGIPQEDHRHFTARLEIIEMEMRRGNRNGVKRELRELIEAARRAGRHDVVRRAEMRELQFSYMLTPYGEPERRLRQLAKSTDPAKRYETIVARLFLSRAYREEGKIAEADELLVGIPRSDDSRRALLYSPPVRLTKAEVTPSSLMPGMEVDNFQDTWIDVAYWIKPDGRVEGVEIVRRGAKAGWAAPLIASIGGRLFEPSKDGTPSYRIERYTYTSALLPRTGTRLLGRVGTPRVELLDLTAPAETGRAPEAAVAPGQPES